MTSKSHKTDKKASNSDLGVLVFSEDLPSRTLKLPKKWFPVLGYLFFCSAVIALTTTATSVFYFRKYRALKQGAPTHLAPQTESKPSTPPPPAKEEAPFKNDEPLAPAINSADFAYFGKKAVAAPKINITAPKLEWNGQSLDVKFQIQYIATDGLNQNGRIVLVARGNGIILTYPKTVITKPGVDSPLTINQGETFSVGRFRQVQASLGPITQRDSIYSLEVFIFDREGNLLVGKQMGVPQ